MTSKQRPKCVREKLRGFFHGPPWIFAWIFLWSTFPVFNGGWRPQKNPRKNQRSSIKKSMGFFTDTFLMPFGKIHGVFHGHFWMPFGRHFGYLLGVILGCLSGISPSPPPIQYGPKACSSAERALSTFTQLSCKIRSATQRH